MEVERGGGGGGGGGGDGVGGEGWVRRRCVEEMWEGREGGRRWWRWWRGEEVVGGWVGGWLVGWLVGVEGGRRRLNIQGMVVVFEPRQFGTLCTNSWLVVPIHVFVRMYRGCRGIGTSISACSIFCTVATLDVQL